MHNSSLIKSIARSLTILRPVSPRQQARKLIKQDGTIIGADKIKRFRHENKRFETIHDLHEILTNLQQENAAVIRGEPACNRQPLTRQLAYRFHKGKPRGDEGFTPRERSWIAIDIDDFALPELVSWISNPEAAVDYIISILPEPYSDCSYIWQLTASHGLDVTAKKWTGGFVENKIRCRIWMVLDRSIHEPETKALLSIIKSFIPEVDLALSGSVQLIYTARPILEENSELDPLSKLNISTMGFVEREYDELPVPKDLQEKIRWNTTSNINPILHVSHPDAEVAIRSIGKPIESNTGRGSIREHIFAAIKKIAADNATLNANQICEIVLSKVEKHKQEIQINLQTHERHWDEVENYLNLDIIRISQWCIDRLLVKPLKAADGAGARKPIRKVNTSNHEKPKLISVEEARNDMIDNFAAFKTEAIKWTDQKEEHEQKIKEYNSLSEEEKDFTRYPSAPEVPYKLISVDTGVGKSHAIRTSSAELIKQLRCNKKTGCVVIAVPRYDLAEEHKEKFETDHDTIKQGISIQILRGREQHNPEQPDEEMCLRLDDVKEIQRLSLRVTENLCYKKTIGEDPIECFHYDECGYLAQQIEADIYIIAHENLFHPPLKIIKNVAVVFVDEYPVSKGLWGISEPYIEIPVDRLRQSDPIPNDQYNLDQFQLMDIRRKLISSLEEHENGSLEYDSLIKAGLTPELCKAARAIEWSRKIDASKLKIRPDMPSERLRKSLKRANGNADVYKLASLFEAIEIFLTQPKNRKKTCGHVELFTRNGVRMLRVSGSRPIHIKWQAPTLIADATADVELLRQIWPQITSFPKYRVKTPNVQYFQVMDRSFSNKAIAPTNKKEEMEANKEIYEASLTNVRKLKAALVKASLRHSCGKVLAIMPKRTEVAILALGRLPSWLDLAHHGALAGLDQYRNVEAVFVIGRQLPRCYEVSKISAALTGISPASNQYVKTTGQIRVEDGIIEVNCYTHPDPTAERVRRQITEAGLMQAIGRGRGVNRKSHNPLVVYIWADIPLPELGVVQPVLWDDIKASIEDEMLAVGAWLENAADAARAHPKLITSADALRKARERQSVTFAYKDIFNSICHSLLHVAYRRALQRSGTNLAVFIKDLIPDPRSWLERALGPLAYYEILASNEGANSPREILLPLPIAQRSPAEQAEIRRALEIFHAFANLQTSSMPSVPEDVLLSARADSVVFMRHWQTDAIILGWPSESLFRAPDKDDNGGLIFQLNGETVIDLQSHQAVTCSGVIVNSSASSH